MRPFRGPARKRSEVIYDARSVISVPVKRGVVTHILLDPDEAITDVATGLGSDCTKPEATCQAPTHRATAV